MKLDKEKRERAAKLIEMLGSDQPGEVTNAAAMLAKTLKEAGGLNALAQMVLNGPSTQQRSEAASGRDKEDIRRSWGDDQWQRAQARARARANSSHRSDNQDAWEFAREAQRQHQARAQTNSSSSFGGFKADYGLKARESAKDVKEYLEAGNWKFAVAKTFMVTAYGIMSGRGSMTNAADALATARAIMNDDRLWSTAIRENHFIAGRNLVVELKFVSVELFTMLDAAAEAENSPDFTEGMQNPEERAFKRRWWDIGS